VCNSLVILRTIPFSLCTPKPVCPPADFARKRKIAGRFLPRIIATIADALTTYRLRSDYSLRFDSAQAPQHVANREMGNGLTPARSIDHLQSLRDRGKHHQADAVHVHANSFAPAAAPASRQREFLSAAPGLPRARHGDRMEHVLALPQAWRPRVLAAKESPIWPGGSPSTHP
jgi:hypothetical protein